MRRLETDRTKANCPRYTLGDKMISLVAEIMHKGLVYFDGSRIYNVSRLDENYEIAYDPTWVEV